MNKQTDCAEFDVLGIRIRVKPDEETKRVSAATVVDYVLQEAAAIKKQSPSIETTHLAVLVALKCAQEKLSVESEYRESLDYFEKTTNEIKALIPKQSE